MHVFLISIILSIITMAVSLEVISFDIICSTTKSGFIYSWCNVGRIKCARRLVFAPLKQFIYFVIFPVDWLRFFFILPTWMFPAIPIFLLYLTALACFVTRIYLFWRNFWIAFYVMLVAVFGVTVGVIFCCWNSLRGWVRFACSC